MKYTFEIFKNHEAVMVGITSGRGTRKEQEEEVRLAAMKNGHKTRLDESYSIRMRVIEEV